MKIVAMADTHGKHASLQVPDGKVLVHAGDLTAVGKQHQVLEALDWIARLPHLAKIVVAGNHDAWCQEDPAGMLAACEARGIVYLCDTGGVVGPSLTVYGSPWTPAFMDWSFMHGRGTEAAKARWDAIPEGLDLLITHGPPLGIGDRVGGRLTGDVDLLHRITTMERPPKLHVFGHIHEDPGVFQLDGGETRFANVTTDYGRRAVKVFEVLA